MGLLPAPADVHHATATQPTAGERAGWRWAMGLTALVAAGATTAAVLGHKTGYQLVFAVLALVILVLPYMAFLTTSVAGKAQLLFVGRPAALVAGVGFFVAVYLLYALGTGAFDWVALLRVFGFAAVPAAFAATAGQRRVVAWQDFAVIACIWLPFNFGLLDSIWEWPEGQAAYVLNTPMAVDVALLLFLAWRRLPNVPLRWDVRLKDLKLIAAALAGFLAVSLPIGFATGFITINPKLAPEQLVGQPLGIFFFIAVPEELLFRGLLLGTLLRLTRQPWLALLVSAVLFGVSHWHNPGLPDFRYLSLATIAGLFYGFTYLRSRSIVVPALLHTAVDTLWALFLHV